MTDMLYEIARNKLIPEAEKYANGIAGFITPLKKADRKVWINAWNKAFHNKMNELAKEKGLMK